MDIKKILVALLVVLALAAVIWFLSRNTEVFAPEQEVAVGGNGGSLTQTAAPSNVSVPEKDSKDLPANVGKPEIVAPAGQNASISFRSFNMKAEAGKFTPDTFIVNEGDITHFGITAVDKNYDITQPDYGINKVELLKGKTKVVEFQALDAGKFTFYCESCGGPQTGPVGYLIVVEKQK